MSRIKNVDWNTRKAVAYLVIEGLFEKVSLVTDNKTRLFVERRVGVYNNTLRIPDLDDNVEFRLGKVVAVLRSHFGEMNTSLWQYWRR